VNRNFCKKNCESNPKRTQLGQNARKKGGRGKGSSGGRRKKRSRRHGKEKKEVRPCPEAALPARRETKADENRREKKPDAADRAH